MSRRRLTTGLSLLVLVPGLGGGLQNATAAPRAVNHPPAKVILARSHKAELRFKTLAFAASGSFTLSVGSHKISDVSHIRGQYTTQAPGRLRLSGTVRQGSTVRHVREVEVGGRSFESYSGGSSGCGSGGAAFLDPFNFPKSIFFRDGYRAAVVGESRFAGVPVWRIRMAASHSENHSESRFVAHLWIARADYRLLHVKFVTAFRGSRHGHRSALEREFSSYTFSHYGLHVAPIHMPHCG